MSLARRTALSGLLAAGIIATTAWALTGPARAQTHLRTGALTPDVIATIMQNYYRAAQPELLPQVIEAAVTQGMTDTRGKRLAFIAFVAGIVSDDPLQIDRLAAVYAKLPGTHYQQLVRAILYSSIPDWQEQIEKLKSAWPHRAGDIAAIAANGARPVYSLKREGQPEVLDMNWAFFGATGRREAVMAVIETLGDLRVQDPVRVATAHAARWSLATQAMQHDLVFEICQRSQWGTYGQELTSIVVAAQSNDLSRFKTDADVAVRAAEAGQAVPAPGDPPARATAATIQPTKRR